MENSLSLIDGDPDHADVESLFSVDDEATSGTVLVFSLDESTSKSNNSSKSDDFNHFLFEIQTF